MNGKISIVIPFYNRADLLLETLASIANQTYSNYECIIVDDHSADDAYSTVEAYVSKKKSFVLKKRSGNIKGACACRNEGIETASGDYIMFLDSDDLLGKTCLEERVAKANEHPTDDFIVCQVGIFNHRDYVVRTYYSSLQHPDDLNAFLNSEGWQTSNTFFRSNFVKRYRFDENAMSWQDVDFHMRVLLDKPRYTKFPNGLPDVYMRRSSFQRISNTNVNFERIESRIRLLLKLELLFEEKNESRYRQPFLVYYFKFLEIAARVLDYDRFKKLFGLWRKSNTCQMKTAGLYSFYLQVQAVLKRVGLRLIGSVLYRLIRYVVPRNLLYADKREVLLPAPVVLQKLEL